MANARQGNLHYVSATGVLRSDKNVKVTAIIVTATAANGVLELADSSGVTIALYIGVPTSGDTKIIEFRVASLLFPNGIKATTVTNAKATLVYTSSGGGDA